MPQTLCRDCCRLTAPDDVCSTASLLEDVCATCGSARRVAHAEIEELGIAHVDCDAFYASVEKRDRPELRDVPLIVGHPGGRGVVTTACYLARRFGVHSAMPMFRALDRCPAATVIPQEMAKYKRVSDDIRAIFLAATEIIEPVSLDEAYLDLTAEHRLRECTAAEALAEIAQRVEHEAGITVSIGLSWNKFLAKLASGMNKPRGFSIIGRAEAKTVLAPLAVRKINGVGEVTAKRLETSGVITIGQLQALSEMQLVTQFGKFGRRLFSFAQGEDDRRVTPHRPVKSVSAETTFRQDIGAADALCAAAAQLCEKVAVQLERKRLAGGTVVLKLKTSDFRLLTRARRLPHPTQRAAVLLETAEHLIRKEADWRTFRLIGIGVDQLHPAADADPPDLFGGSLS